MAMIMMMIDDDNNHNDYIIIIIIIIKYIDKVGTFESQGHSSKCSIVHSGEYSIKGNLREKNTKGTYC